MNYKETICKTMANLSATNPKMVFIGYNVKSGKFGGTLHGVDESKMVETTVAENLMTSMAIGLSIEGFLPVVCFERMDFILNSLDAIVNHLDKLKKISQGEYDPKVLIRCVVGNKHNPLFTGETHVQDFSSAIKLMAPGIDVFTIRNKMQIEAHWNYAIRSTQSTILVEYKDLYNDEQ